MDMLSKWHRAQEKERSFHGGDSPEKIQAYRSGYEQYFKYLETQRRQTNKIIIEIGPADVPALCFCHGFREGIIIEPLPSALLNELAKKRSLTVISLPAEQIEFPQCDEVWLLNVLQHVIDADTIINKAKQAAKKIRFFEPINDSIDECHLHSFSLDYFKNHFGDVTKHYEDHTGKVTNFHEHECAYGIWINPDK